tara:strand:- start:59 stop:517 length:459 start_codon:yes stop_codon:yes gene_type:complete
MVSFILKGCAMGKIIAATPHGLTDFENGPSGILPYTYLFLPLGGDHIFKMFMISSVLHFAQDIGLIGSVALHGILGGASLVSVELSSILFSTFYLGVHVPRAIQQAKKPALYSTLCTLTLPFTRHITTLRVTESMQRLVTCHCISSLIHDQF